MRILSLHLPFLATDRIRRMRGAAPPEEGVAPLVTVAKVKGADRLVALDARARALGLRPMLTLADARAMHPGLAVHPADPDGERATLLAIVDWCGLFTPLAAPDGDDGAVLDVTGAAHLHGGEAGLAETMDARLARQGFSARLAVAGTAGAAWALARTGEGSHPLIEGDTDPSGRARLFAPLPLAALRLPEAMVAGLAQAGLRRVGDLLLRPRGPIAARFGPEPHRRLDALLGLAREPISPRFPAPLFVAERRFVEGLSRREDVEGTILALGYDLCGLLARHGEGARRLEVTLFRVDGAVRRIEAGASRPLRDPQAMARLFRERLEARDGDAFDPGYGIEMVRLAALAAERLDEAQPGLGGEGDPSDEARAAEFADLLDRLGARFGLRRVVRLQLADSHQPERAAAAARPTAPRPGRPARQAGRSSRLAALRSALPCAEWQEEERLPTLPERPIRLLARPEPIEAIAAVPDGPPLRFRWRRVLHVVAAVEGPERIAPDWWAAGAEAGALTRDYFRAEDVEGGRFWLYRDGLYRETAEPRWYVHGLFA